MQTKRLRTLSGITFAGIMLCTASASHTANNAAHMPNQAIPAIAQVALLALAPIGGALDLVPAQRDQANPPLYPQAKFSDAHYRRLALLANKRENGDRGKKNRQKSYNRPSNKKLNQPQQRRKAPKGR
jgi:hypothetical protein